MSHDHAHGHDHGHAHAPPPPAPADDHGHSHGAHDHGHGHGPRTPDRERRLLGMLVLSSLYIFVEVVGGYLSGSLALLADAGHMASDAGALAVTLFAFRLARRPATARATYGYHRAEVLAAVLNGGALIAIAVGILWEAAERLQEPTQVMGPMMMGIAAGGLLVNLLGLALLHGDHHDDLNMRGAWLHVLSDALGSVGALVAGALVYWKGWTWADPVASAVIALLVVRASWRLLMEATNVLMEGAPAHIDVDAVRTTIRDTAGVSSVHDLHVWTITSGIVAMSGHVVPDGTVESHQLLGALGDSLRARFGIDHTTIQIEPSACGGQALHP